MIPTPYILGNQWPTTKARWNGTQEREQCEKCKRWCVLSGIGRHRAKCLGVLKAEVPEGHRKCGIDGCERILPLRASRCYLHEEATDGRMDEMDRANGWGRYKAGSEAR